MMARRNTGRGRLSSLDLLPVEAEADYSWALGQLAKRERTQEAIRDELNLRLLGLGLEPVSKSAFNRKAMSFALMARQIEQTREMAGIMAERMDNQPEGDVGLLLGELIKSLTFDVLSGEMMDGEAPSMKTLKTAAETVDKLERARKANVDTAARIKKQFADQAMAAVDEAGKQAGLSAENLKLIREQVYGIMEK
jgi:cytochrome P450